MYSDHHVPIVSHESFDAVQVQRKLRSNTIENLDGTKSRKPTKYSEKRAVQEIIDQRQVLADLDTDVDSDNPYLQSRWKWL